MIATAVLPKTWTARASDLDVMSEIKQINDGWSGKSFTLVDETGPEIISNSSTTIQVKATDEGMRMVKEIQNRPKIHAINGPIRIYVDDQYGGTTELARAISAEFTIK